VLFGAQAFYRTNYGSVMVKPWEFLERWVREHVKATHYDETTKRQEARKLAKRCLRDAEEAGVDKAALIKAAGNDLFIFLLTGLDGAAPAVEKID
jgi:hypothetical protein